MPLEELPLVTVSLQRMAGMMTEGQLRDPRGMAFVPTRRAVDWCNAAAKQQAPSGRAAAAPENRMLRQIMGEADGPGGGGGGAVFPAS